MTVNQIVQISKMHLDEVFELLEKGKTEKAVIALRNHYEWLKTITE